MPCPATRKIAWIFLVCIYILLLLHFSRDQQVLAAMSLAGGGGPYFFCWRPIMFDPNSDLGAALFQTWSDKQRFEEIEKLVQGYRGGVPVGILCKMSETIAGNKKKAKKILKQLLSADERKTAVKSAEGGMIPIVKSFLE